MSDLISRSDVIKTLEECNLDKQLFEKDVFEKINSILTIEAVPVVHGEWKICEEPNTYDTYGHKVTYARCKNCGFTWRNKYHVNNYFKHCPNCGADMRKGGAE